MVTNNTLPFELRPASGGDFQFCWSLYRDLMRSLTIELLQWNETNQRQVIEESLTDSGASIIVASGSDIGWLQVKETLEEIYLGQLYITPSMQNRGIGTAVVRQLCESASHKNKILTLEVMKNNRARLFHERLGFEVVSLSKYKLKLKWRQA